MVRKKNGIFTTSVEQQTEMTDIFFTNNQKQKAMVTLNNFNLGQLDNGSHFLFVSHVLEQAEADATVSAKAAKYLSQFKNAVEAEDDVLKITTKSLLTDEIAVADASRDAIYIALKGVTKRLVSSLNAETVKAATVLNQVLVDYAIDTQEAMIKETGLMLNLLKDLTTTHKAQVEKLGLTVIVDELNQSNARVNTLMTERTEERQFRKTGEMKAARAVTDEAYRLLVMMVNGLVLAEGEEAYLKFVTFVNAEIVYFRQQALKQKGGAPSAGGDDAGSGDNPGGSDNPGGGEDTGGSGNPGGGEDTGGSGGDDDDEFVG